MKSTRLTLMAFVLTAAQAPAGTPSSAGPALPKGTKLAEFQAMGVNGRQQRVDYPAGSTTMLLFFMSSCPTCQKMIPEWNVAYGRRSPKLRVYGVMLDREAPGFFETTTVAFPVLRVPGNDAAEQRAFTQRFGVKNVPVTLRVGPGGVVEDSHVGLADRIRLGELFAPPS